MKAQVVVLWMVERVLYEAKTRVPWGGDIFFTLAWCKGWKLKKNVGVDEGKWCGGELINLKESETFITR